MPSTRANVSVLYWLHLAGFVTGITPLIALVMAYMGRGQDGDAVADSHYTYVIRTFWIGTLYAAIALVSMAVLIGFVLLPVAAIWWIVRSAKGLSCAGRGQPIPKPTTWLW
ncbi:MAG: hypothetical protein JO048_03945 [Methylobacteriaceae bacterium]|nr:hypothetical protein [Methylobacteriaceae bacterium]